MACFNRSLASLAFWALFSTLAHADAPTSKPVALEVGVGVLKGGAEERVVSTGGTLISRLSWDVDSIAVATARVSWSPVPRFTFLGKGYVNLSGDADMVDRDWVAECPGGLCQSRHPDTRVTLATGVDVSGIYHFYRTRTVSLGATAGYRFDHTAWEANGGTSNYATIPSGLGISYAQTWEAPYGGLAAVFNQGNWLFGARIVGSLWGQGQDEDTHHWRRVRFAETYDQVRMFGASARLAYSVTDAMSLAVDYDYTHWLPVEAGIQVTDLANGQAGMAQESRGGAESRMQSLVLSLAVRF